MADTNTANLALVKQTEGGNENTWGAILNENFDKIDAQFGGVTAIATTGGSTTLTAAQQRAGAVHVSGTLVSAATLNFNATGGLWLVKNATTGSFSLTVKVTGQTGFTIQQGKSVLVYFDGTDLVKVSGAVGLEDGIITAAMMASGVVFPSTTAMLFAQTAAPTGWTKSATTYDHALRVTSGTPSTGGSVNFSTFLARTATDSHQLTVSEMPSHTHDVTHMQFLGQGSPAATNLFIYAASGAEATGPKGGDAAHTHNIDCRIKYLDTILATRD